MRPGTRWVRSGRQFSLDVARPGLHLGPRRVGIEIFDFNPVSQPPNGALAADHDVCDFRGVSLGQDAGFADGTEGADLGEELVYALGVENVATGQFPDYGY